VVAIKQNGFPVDGVEAQQAAVEKRLNQAYQQLAANVLGVAETEIHIGKDVNDTVAGKINIVARLDGATGDMRPEGGFNYEQDPEKNRGKVSIRRDQIEKPELAGYAAQELYHETSHRKDLELTQQWVKKYQDETNRPFVDQAQGRFQEWILSQAPKRISRAEAETIIDEAGRGSGATEARANVHAAMQALQAGRPDLAAFQLKNYVEGMAKGTYASPGNHVEAGLTDELRQAYRQMSPDMQKQLRDAVAAAKAANPNAWVSKLSFKS
jgi:hypothetical protein